jgi:hypothetical protein
MTMVSWNPVVGRVPPFRGKNPLHTIRLAQLSITWNTMCVCVLGIMINCATAPHRT